MLNTAQNKGCHYVKYAIYVGKSCCVLLWGFVFFIHAINLAAIISNYITSVFERKETRMMISRYFAHQTLHTEL